MPARVTQSLATALVVSVAVFWGCDAVPGVRDASDLPPAVSDFDFSPRTVDISQLDPQDLADGLTDVNLNVSVAVDGGPEGDVDSVYFVVRPPLRTGMPVATGVLLPVGDGRYEAASTVTLPVGQPGNYVVVVYASDQQGQLSNQVQGNLFLDATNAVGNPPIVEQVEAFPEVMTPPGTLVIVATVSDPEGLLNILRVEITTPTDQKFAMADDGESLGDEVADDGRYTAAFNVSSGLPPGVQVFKVQAFDRNGNVSNVVDRPVTIQ